MPVGLLACISLVSIALMVLLGFKVCGCCFYGVFRVLSLGGFGVVSFVVLVCGFSCSAGLFYIVVL